MKIDNVSQLLQSRALAERAGGERSTGVNGDGGTETSANVSQLRQPADGSRDIDSARVAEIRQAIADGHLEIRADRIADGLIASVREMLETDPQ